MSKVIQTLTAIASNTSGSPLIRAFESNNLVYYPINPTLEPEIKMLWSTKIQGSEKQLKTIFKAWEDVSEHDKKKDHFVYIPHTVESGNYDLTSFATDTVKRNPKTGGPVPTMLLAKAGYQGRSRMAISLASREEQLLEEIKAYSSPDALSKNPIQKLSPSTCFGPPEYSIKTKWSGNQESVFRDEFEAKVDSSPDIIGMFLTALKKELPKELYNLLRDTNKDRETSLNVMAVCMTRRTAYFVAHYVAEHDAYVLYECTLDRNKFCSPNSTYTRGQDLEQEYEAICVLPSARDVQLSQEEQDEILNTSLDNFVGHVKKKIKGLSRSPGSKMERATIAVDNYYRRKIATLPEYFQRAATDRRKKDTEYIPGQLALMEQVSIHEAMAYIGNGYAKLAHLFADDHSEQNFVDKNLFPKRK